MSRPSRLFLITDWTIEPAASDAAENAAVSATIGTIGDGCSPAFAGDLRGRSFVEDRRHRLGDGAAAEQPLALVKHRRLAGRDAIFGRVEA